VFHSRQWRAPHTQCSMWWPLRIVHSSHCSPPSVATHPSTECMHFSCTSLAAAMKPDWWIAASAEASATAAAGFCRLSFGDEVSVQTVLYNIFRIVAWPASVRPSCTHLHWLYTQPSKYAAGTVDSRSLCLSTVPPKLDLYPPLAATYLFFVSSLHKAYNAIKVYVESDKSNEGKA